MSYVDGFVVVVPKKKIEAYRKLARKAGKIWREHGALQYVEAAGDDLDIKFGLPFPKLAKPKPSETIVFSWILYKSRKHRDSVNKKVMERMAHEKMPEMPFDCKKMAWGGFKVIADV